MKRFLNFAIRLSIVNFLLLLLFIGFIIQDKSSTSTQLTPSRKTPPINLVGNTANHQEASPVVRNLFSELSEHSTIDNCWITYSGHIYDITTFFGSHPGGDAIMLKYCGNDATAAFDSKDQSPAVAHSGSALSLLQGYLVQ